MKQGAEVRVQRKLGVEEEGHAVRWRVCVPEQRARCKSSGG